MNSLFPSKQNNRLSAKDLAYYEIKERIIKNELTPDVSLIEESLSNELSISRTPLREALQKLEHEGLVIRQTNGRLKVSPISIKELKEIFIVRNKLEEIAVEEAIKNTTEQDIINLSTIVLLIKDNASNNRFEEVLYYGEQFHSYIYELSGNKTIQKILQLLNDRILRYKRLVLLPSKSYKKNSKEEHALILDCIERRDVEGAKNLMREHIKKSIEIAISNIEKINHK